MKIKKQIVIKNLAQSEWSDMCLVELSRAGCAEGRVVMYFFDFFTQISSEILYKDMCIHL